VRRNKVEFATNMVAVMHVYVPAELSTCCVTGHRHFKQGELLFQAISSGLFTAVTIYTSYQSFNAAATGCLAIIIDKSVVLAHLKYR
jgi:hypothetical protein